MSYGAKDLAAQAESAYQAGEFQQAIGQFAAARDSYRAEGEIALAAEMANSLSVVMLQAGRPEEALSAVEGTAEVFSEVGDSHRAAIATGNLAAALEACGKIDQAEAAYAAAAAGLAAAGDQQAQRHTLKALSQLQLRQNRPLEAAATLSAGQPDRSIRGRILRTLLSLPAKFLRS